MDDLQLEEQSCNISCAFFREINCLTYLLGALTLTVAISLSAEAQIAPGPPALLNTNGTSDLGKDTDPHVATDGAGNWVAVWASSENLGGTVGTDTDIFVARSTNCGATWTAPTLLNTNGTSDSGEDGGPEVTTDGAGNWVAVWWSNNYLGGMDYDVFVATSSNNGMTWTAPALLNTNGTSDSGNDGAPEVTTDGLGNWVAVWVSDEDLGGTAGKDFDIFTARSTTNGATWTAPALLNTNGTSDSAKLFPQSQKVTSGNDMYPQVTTDGAGNWVAVWGSDEDLGGTAGTDTDIFVARSTNNGATWSAPALLNANAASSSGNENSPNVATDGAGNWVAVWMGRNGQFGTPGADLDILVATSTNNGVTWTAPALLNTNGTSDSGDDMSPEVTTDGAGNWVAVWRSSEDPERAEGADWDVLIATSTNNGATWSASALLNTNAAPRSGNDYTPEVTADGAGNWVAVWGSNEDLDGEAGTDFDIFVTTFEAKLREDGAMWTAPALLNTLAGLALVVVLAGAWVVLKRRRGHEEH